MGKRLRETKARARGHGVQVGTDDRIQAGEQGDGKPASVLEEIKVHLVVWAHASMACGGRTGVQNHSSWF